MPNSRASETGEPAVDEGVEQQRDLQSELEVMADRYKRALADLDNYRKRSARETERRIVESKESLLREWLQPVDSGWVRLALNAPLMSCERAATELGWRPRTDAATALRELVDGMATHAHTDAPPLSGAPAMAGRPGGLLRGRLPGTGDPY